MRSALLLVLATNAVWMSLGLGQMFATPKECDAIYGRPEAKTEKSSDVRFYKHDGLTIKILFVEEKASVLTFTSTTSLKMPEDILKKLLGSNAAGGEWEEVEGEGAKTWRRSDGLAFAMYDNANGELNFFSTDYIENSKSEVQAAINQQ